MEELQGQHEVVRNKINEFTSQNEVLSKRIELRNEEVKTQGIEKDILSKEVEDLKKEIVILENRQLKLDEKLKFFGADGKHRGRNVKMGKNRGSNNHGANYTSSIKSNDSGA